jgi:hypothetical protein
MKVGCQLHTTGASPPAEGPQYALDRMLGGPPNQSGRCGEEQNFCLCRESVPTYSAVRSHSLSMYRLSLHTHTHTRTRARARTHTHTHALSRALSRAHTRAHTLAHTLALTLTLTHSLTLSHSLTHSLTLTHPHSHTLTLTHSHALTLTHTHSHTRRGLLGVTTETSNIKRFLLLLLILRSYYALWPVSYQNESGTTDLIHSW